ncbi:hypothetical protein [Nocardia shimofusensis]|uniref:hypothetical protein n=1 Tax=Nocardia shimofusensis TaxID=228596 RepID=UPI000834C97A|nr:hypothetical protein [Nocardia shimofusensis]
MDIVELRTPTAIVRHGHGRLIVLRPGGEGDAEGERVLDVPVDELLKVRLSRRADDAVVIEIYLRHPAPVLTGVPADRTPLPVLIAEHDVPAAGRIVERINDQILNARRVDIAAPELDPPAPVWTEDGPTRGDVDRAVSRMTPRADAEAGIAALHHFVRPDEYVLETAVATARPAAGPGLLAATTCRVLFVSLDPENGFAYEFPVAAVLYAHATETPAGAPGEIGAARGETGLDIHDGHLTLRFTGADRADMERVACAVTFAVRREAVDGAAGPSDPGVAQLYAEWELLVERHSLGMVDDVQFQRYGRGILRSLPDAG